MAFDVSKFLALTALIAGTGYACSSSDKNEPGGGAGSSGSAGQSGGGKSGNQGGAADAGNAGAAVSKAGEGGAPITAGAGAGGEALGGAGGAGGAVDPGECLGALAVVGGAGGAGGAVAVEPSLEGLCMDFFDVVCPASAEGTYAPSFTVCEGVKASGQPAVAVAVADCIKALSAEDACDNAKVSACFTGLEGKGCPNPDSAAVCAVITGRDGCDAIAQASCEKIADLVSPDMFEGFTGCMNPTEEGWFDPGFTGTCAERLDNCAGVKLPL